MRHPEIAARSCEDCAKWWFLADGSLKTRSDASGKVKLPLLRPPGVATPCDSCPKIPADEPKTAANAVVLSEAHRLTWQHWLECRAVNWQVPDVADPIVRRNAALIQSVYDEAKEDSQRDLMALLALNLKRGK